MRYFLLAVFINDLLTTSIGLTANSLIIYLCCKVRCDELKQTKVFIAAHAITDLTITLVYTVLRAALFLEKDRLFFTFIGPLANWPISICRILFAIFCFFFQLDILTLSLGFIYRCAIICRKNFLKKIFTRRCFWLLMLCLIATAAAFSGSLISVMEFTIADLPPNVSKEFGRPIRVAVNRKSWNILYAFCIFLIVGSLVSYLLIAICVRAILKTLTSVELNIRTRKMQAGITIGMILQAVLPLVFTTLPMIGVIILVISPFELNIGAYGTLIVSILYWQPCVYPLLSLYFVRPLREELRRQTHRAKITFVSSKSQLPRMS